MKTVIFHKHCWDGFCAAWLFHQTIFRHEIGYVAAQYGDTPSDCKGQDVFIADFSYSLEAMLAIAGQAKSLTVLDHHKTAEEALAGFHDVCMAETGLRPTVVFDMGKSGGRLAWEYLYGRGYISARDCPWLVDYTEDRDLWRWALPLSREINAALHSYPLDFTTWDELSVQSATALALEGKAILRRDQQVIAEHVARAYEAMLGNYRVLAVNATSQVSDIAGELAKGRPFGVAWFERADAMRQYSLRSDEGGVDVAEIATCFGGGGHKHAAGFSEPLHRRAVQWVAP